MVRHLVRLKEIQKQKEILMLMEKLMEILKDLLMD